MPDPLTTHLSTAGKASGPLSVLILDDERFDRHRMARLCSGLPVACDITNAQTLQGFEATLNENGFDLILLDYLLPDGTGLQALDAVRRSVRNYASATIMVTGHADPEVADAARRAGCADYLTKTEMTTQAFHDAVVDALRSAALTLKADAQNFERAEVEAVLEVFVKQFSGEFKPLISRSLRLVRDLRAKGNAQTMNALEETCLELWETAIHQERHGGEAMMTQTLMQPKTATHIPIRKPPSPFARIRQ